jgi:two-component system LytT family sensor kinase
MKENIKNPLNLNQIEFWASTTLFVFSVFILITQANYGPDYQDQYYGHYQNADGYTLFLPRLCRYAVLYIAFLAFNFRIVPALVKNQPIVKPVLATIGLFCLLCLTYAITDTYLEYNILLTHVPGVYFDVHILEHSMLQSLWILMIYALYSAIKYASVSLLNYLDKVEPQHHQVTRESIIAFIAWLVLLFILISIHADPGLIILWGFSIFLAILIYWYSFYQIIPYVKFKKQRFINYMGIITFMVFISLVLISIVVGSFEHHIVIPILLLNTAFQLLITAPLTWQMYRYRSASNAELYRLKTALGQSNASYNLLQSQINPHFLFNALNTLYGTALQENADRTGEGIQQLGDMMRFMLHENMQESISLAREIDYLHHFIALQKLRTQTSPDIVIQSEIPQQVQGLQIAPMLLIPFVENAFKHGISLREPSHIKITLHTTGNTLYFDVYNSIHIKPDNDPEKGHSGIGLINLRQRLQLVYPKKHELIIRETATEYFVHLTLQLNIPRFSDEASKTN